MKIVLNGKETEFPKPVTLAELLKNLAIPPERVACEVNLKIIRRKDYADTRIAEGDQVEVLQMIGGG